MKNNKRCEACECTPCDCGWGNYPIEECERCGLIDCECHWGDQIKKGKTYAEKKTSNHDQRTRKSSY